MQPSALPKSISVTVLHDGRVLFELLADWYTSLAIAESRVDAGERTAGILIGWTNARLSAAPRSSARAEFADTYHDGYVVTLPGSNREMLRVDVAPAALERRFALAFNGQEAGSPPAAARDFARDFSRWLGGFYARSRRLAEVRLAGGRYLAIMQAYLDDARAKVDAADQDYYQEFSKSVGAVIADERYLLLSEHGEARRLYGELEAERSDLYNWYMNLAKGGVVGSRRPSGV